MQRRRVADGLVGAAVAVLVLLVAVTALLLVISRPTSDPPQAPPPAAGGSPGVPRVPSDLAEGETYLGDLDLKAGIVASPGSLLRDVRALGQDVRAGPSSLVAGSLSVQATVPFDVVEAQVGPGNTIRAAGSQASVTRDVEVAGRTFRVVATGTVDVVRGRLVIEPRSIDVGGPEVLSGALAGLVRGLVQIEHEVEGLPEGLVLQEVTVQEDGFRAVLEGEEVRLVSRLG